ncbi:hypothetical protein ACFQ1Q_12355 [Winogradskyella litorisediminis]|uniref:Lipoprotein n=1 Tax=Winogradskyella litorisediminis TaxID=1156618 RepID=A0ABW3NC14_9FLAO
MKNRLIYSFAFFTILTFNSCGLFGNDSSECDEKLIKQTKKIDELSEKLSDSENELQYRNKLDSLAQTFSKNTKIEQSIKPVKDITLPRTNIERYDVFGDFSVQNKSINIFIPVTDENLKIKSFTNISSSNVNAILIRVSNNSDAETKKTPITHVIEAKFKFDDFNISSARLNQDKKLKVMVLNENTRDISTQTTYYKKCIESVNRYEKLDCRLPTIKPFKPNEDGGDIITGG